MIRHKPKAVTELMTPKEVPLIHSLSGLHISLRNEELPGPGHYQLNIPDQIKFLTDKLAPRYKQNPFGSNISRFTEKKPKRQTKLVTEDQIRA